VCIGRLKGRGSTDPGKPASFGSAEAVALLPLEKVNGTGGEPPSILSTSPTVDGGVDLSVTVTATAGWAGGSVLPTDFSVLKWPLASGLWLVLEGKSIATAFGMLHDDAD